MIETPSPKEDSNWGKSNRAFSQPPWQKKTAQTDKLGIRTMETKTRKHNSSKQRVGAGRGERNRENESALYKIGRDFTEEHYTTTEAYEKKSASAKIAKRTQ